MSIICENLMGAGVRLSVLGASAFQGPKEMGSTSGKVDTMQLADFTYQRPHCCMSIADILQS